MKHPTVDYRALVEILSEIPKGTPWIYVLFGYIVAVLHRHDGNRTHAAADMGMNRRTLTYRLGVLDALEFPYPPPHKRAKHARRKSPLHRVESVRG